MPIQIIDLLQNERTLTFEIDGQRGQITYRPGAMTPELEMLLTKRTDPSRAVAEILSELIVTWDVLGEDGEPVPTDLDTLMQLPSTLVATAYREIAADMSDLREERKNSAAGSRREASRDRRRRGSSFSERRDS